MFFIVNKIDFNGDIYKERLLIKINFSLFLIYIFSVIYGLCFVEQSKISFVFGLVAVGFVSTFSIIVARELLKDILKDYLICFIKKNKISRDLKNISNKYNILYKEIKYNDNIIFIPVLEGNYYNFNNEFIMNELKDDLEKNNYELIDCNMYEIIIKKK